MKSTGCSSDPQNSQDTSFGGLQLMACNIAVHSSQEVAEIELVNLERGWGSPANAWFLTGIIKSRDIAKIGDIFGLVERVQNTVGLCAELMEA